MQVIQYMSIQRAPLLGRLLQKMLSQESTIIFDLEATLSSHNSKEVHQLKAWGRKELLSYVHSHPDLTKTKKIGIRVNSLQSNELELDVDLLREISTVWDLHCIVVPMIHSPNCIDQHLALLRKKRVVYTKLIPIIETKVGVNNLSSIVAHPEVTAAQYGHQDYCLDIGCWPFLQQDEVAFWEIVAQFIQTVEQAGVSYIHPPASAVSHEQYLAQIYTRLHKLCNLPFEILSISPLQTAMFNHFKMNPMDVEESPLQTPQFTFQEKIDLAHYIQKVCSAKERNFRIDPATRMFFSPHQYTAALRFLEQNNE